METPQEFRPELTPRRGELIAWGSAILVGFAWFVLVRSGQGVNFTVPLLTVVLLLAALSISLSNWMDRSTLLRLDEAGITFRNGLRSVNLTWEQIRQVQVLPAHWGKKVRVVGEGADEGPEQFDFLTLGEVKVKGEVKGRVGFSEGKQILEEILARADLHLVDKEDAGRAAQNERYYYARD